VNSAALRLFFDNLGCLLLSSYQNDILVRRRSLSRIFACSVKSMACLIEINHVDSIAFTVDVWTHLRIPAVRMMSEVNTGF
jgi:hypothetical protein